MDTFENTIPLVMKELEESLSAGDTRQAMLHAHSIKGTAANLSAMELSQIAAEIEKALRNGDEAHSKTFLAPLKKSLSTCLTAFPEIRKELTGGFVVLDGGNE